MTKKRFSVKIAALIMGGGCFWLTTLGLGKGIVVTAMAAIHSLPVNSYIQISDWTAPLGPEYLGWQNESGEVISCGQSTNSSGKLNPIWKNIDDLSWPLRTEVEITSKNKGNEENGDLSRFDEWLLSENQETWTQLSNLFVDEEGSFNFNLKLSDVFGNQQLLNDACPIQVDRSAPISQLSGNLPIIDSNFVFLNWQFHDESLTNALNSPGKIQLYYRFQFDDHDWQGDFRLVDERILSSGENEGNFYFNINYLDGEGYYQFVTIASDEVGNEESWPADPSLLPVTWMGELPLTTSIPKMEIQNNFLGWNYDGYGGWSVPGDNEWFPNLDFENDLDYWLTTTESNQVQIIAEEDTLTNKKIEAAQGNKFLRLTNWQATGDELNVDELAAKYSLTSQTAVFHTLTFEYRLVGKNKLNGLNDQILHFDLCGNRGVVGSQVWTDDVNEDGWFDSEWQTIQLSGYKCQPHEDKWIKFYLDDRLLGDDEIFVYLDNLRVDQNLIGPRTIFKIQSEDEEFDQIGCEFSQQTHRAENPFYVSFNQPLANNELACWLQDRSGNRGPKVKTWIDFDGEVPEVNEEWWASLDWHTEGGENWNYLEFETLMEKETISQQPLIREVLMHHPRGMSNWRGVMGEPQSPYWAKLHAPTHFDSQQLAGYQERLLIKREDDELTWLVINYYDQALNAAVKRIELNMNTLEVALTPKEGL